MQQLILTLAALSKLLGAMCLLRLSIATNIHGHEHYFLDKD